MERMFYTLIKQNHAKFGGNKYVIGRIHGFMTIICRGTVNESGFTPTRIIKSGRVIGVKCEPDKYDEFKKVTELYYPGLCEFDVDSFGNK